MPKFFAWSEFLVVNSNFVYKIPEKMSFKDAAAFSYSYLTAYILLFELGCVKSDQTVLFHSAGGSVGTALMQLAKLVKNVTMIGTCSKSKFEAIKGNAQYLFEENTDYTIEIKK